MTKYEPTFREKYAITDKEKEAIIQLVAERYCNYVYIEAENTVRGMVNRMCDKCHVENDDTLSMTFTVSQVVADVLVCLGECRRKLERK